jgi:hypothetical protein
MRTKPPSKVLRFFLRIRTRVVKASKRFLRRLGPAEPKTAGEAAFEEYLRENGIPFAYELQEEGKARRPDYTIKCRGVAIKLDVKDVEDETLAGNHLEVNEAALVAVALGNAPDDGHAVHEHVGGGGYDPHPALREKINTARQQFKEYKGMPCAIVLHSTGRDADLRSPEIMLGVMYGNFGISIPFNPERGDFVGTEAEAGFLSGGSVVHRRKSTDETRIQNTTISALITIRQVKIGCARLAEYYSSQPDRRAAYSFDPALHARLKVDKSHYGLIVWENAFAANPLPKDLFRGPYDEYWSTSEPGAGNVRTFVGEKLQWTLDRYPDAVSPLWRDDDLSKS